MSAAVLRKRVILDSISLANVASALAYLRHASNPHPNRYALFCELLERSGGAGITLDQMMKHLVTDGEDGVADDGEDGDADGRHDQTKDVKEKLFRLFVENKVTLFRFFACRRPASYPDVRHIDEPTRDNFSSVLSFVYQLSLARPEALKYFKDNPAMESALAHLSAEEALFYALHETTCLAPIIFLWLCRNLDVSMVPMLNAATLNHIRSGPPPSDNLLQALATIMYETIIGRLFDTCYTPFPFFFQEVERSGRPLLQMAGSQLNISFTTTAQKRRLRPPLNAAAELLVQSLDRRKWHFVTSRQPPANSSRHAFNIYEKVYHEVLPVGLSSDLASSSMPVFDYDMIDFSSMLVFPNEPASYPPSMVGPDPKQTSQHPETNGLGQMLGAFNIIECVRKARAYSVSAKPGVRNKISAKNEEHSFRFVCAVPAALSEDNVIEYFVKHFYLAEPRAANEWPEIFNRTFVDFFVNSRGNQPAEIVHLSLASADLASLVKEEIERDFVVRVGPSRMLPIDSLQPIDQLTVELNSTCLNDSESTNMLLRLDLEFAAFQQNLGQGAAYRIVFLVLANSKMEWLEQKPQSTALVSQSAIQFANLNSMVFQEKIFEVRRDKTIINTASFTMSQFQAFYHIFPVKGDARFRLIVPRPAFELDFTLN